MNKLKVVIGILAIASLFLGQCGCPHTGNNPTGSFGKQKDDYHSPSYIIGDWQNDTHQLSFKEDGILTMKVSDETTISNWTLSEGILEVAKGNDISLYTIEELNETNLKIFDGKIEISLYR